jgi:cation transport protein ChaC
MGYFHAALSMLGSPGLPKVSTEEQRFGTEYGTSRCPAAEAVSGSRRGLPVCSPCGGSDADRGNKAGASAMKHDPSSTQALTEDLVAHCAREVPDPGPSADGVVFGDDDYLTAARQVLESWGAGPIWIFAYGSLLWKPAVEQAESLLATAEGWHRSFCIAMSRWRGSPEQPGLMLALRRGGSCTGLAQRVPQGDRLHQMVTLLRREIGGPEGMASLRIIDVSTAQGPLRALCFYADPIGNIADLPAPEVARILARACGHIGSGAEYLHKTTLALESHGIRDIHLWELQELVAQEIRAQISPGVNCVPEN